MPTPSVSVVIRNRNEAEHLELVLRALAQQTIQPEIVVVDNESTDESVAVAERYGARVVRIDACEFVPGRALNRGLALTTAPVAVILSPDSMPLGRHFLMEALLPFRDERVAAARLVHAGHPDDVRDSLDPTLLGRGDDWLARSPRTSGCAIRRATWDAIRFSEDAEAAEGPLFARCVLDTGGRIYSAAPAVYVSLRPIPAEEQIQRDEREIAEIYRATGRRLGHLAQPRPLRDLARGLAVQPLAAAWTRAQHELLRASARRRFARDATRPEFEELQ